MRRSRWDGQEGRLLVLGVGMAAVCVLLLAAVVTATALHVQRKALYAAADMAVLAAAQAVSRATLYGLGEPSATQDADAARRARAHVAAGAPEVAGCRNVRVVSARSTEEGGVEVVLACDAQLPLVSHLWEGLGGGLVITARSSAVIAVG